MGPKWLNLYKKTGCNAVDQKFNNYAFLFLSTSADLGIGLV